VRGGVVAGVLACLLPAGCGDATSPEFQEIENADFAQSLGIDLSRMTLKGAGVYFEDLELGTGDPVGIGTFVQVAYTGWLTDGSVFDAGSFPFTVGTGQVVQGFDEGVEGMRLGGKRKVVIPPGLAYGNIGTGSIPPGSILIFDIEVLTVG